MEFLPWYNEPTIAFLNKILNNKLTVFEYGGGNSTLFYARQTKKVYTIETRKKWVDYILFNGQVFNNIEIKLCSFLPNFANEIESFSINKFDLIVIDLRDRSVCLHKSINFLKPGGIILLDNSERGNLKRGAQKYYQYRFYGNDISRDTS